MSETLTWKAIPVSLLLLDVDNPRLPEVQNSQHSAIISMVKSQEEKIIILAQHLVNHGPNPASLLIVTPAADGSGEHFVLDGNRRVAALKLLEMPSLVDGIISNKLAKKLRQLSSRFHKNPITEMNCVVLPSRDHADAWIVLIHRGQQQGAGLVEWDGQVAARYDARRADKQDLALEVLSFVRQGGGVSEQTMRVIDEGKFPITTLRRLLNTRYVRNKLGIEVSEDQKLGAYFTNDEVLRGLNRVVDDIGTGQITVSGLKSQDDRIDYINRLSNSALPDPEKRLPTTQLLVPFAPSQVGDPSSTPVTSISSTKSFQQSRKTLIPRTCKLNIIQPRINAIFRELKILDIDAFPNAGAVLLRVFVELSLDQYVERILQWPEQQIANSSLAHKLTGVANHFEKNQLMTSDQLAVIKKAAAGQTLLAAAIKTLHGYVHNKHFSPIASELKVVWDDFQPFMEIVWQ